jgi:hypothetical protein
MIFKIINLLERKHEYLEGTEQEAAARAAELKSLYMAQEDYRFSISYEEVNGAHTTWRAANLLTDPADGLYNVFNHKTGQYEKITGLSTAVTRLAAIKEEFVQEFSIGHFEQVDSIPAAPISQGSQTF